MDYTNKDLDDFIVALQSSKNSMFEYRRIHTFKVPNYSIKNAQYNLMVEVLDRRGLIITNKTRETEYFRLNFAAIKNFKGFEKEALELEITTKEKEEFRSLELESLRSTINQSKSSKKIALWAIGVSVFAVLVPFAQWIYDKTHSSDNPLKKLQKNQELQQLKIDSITKLLDSHLTKPDSTTSKKK